MFWICHHHVKFCDDRLRIAKVIDISILTGSRLNCACAIKHKVDFRYKVFWIIYQPIKFGKDQLRIARVIGLDISKQAGCRHLTAHAQKPVRQNSMQSVLDLQPLCQIWRRSIKNCQSYWHFNIGRQQPSHCAWSVNGWQISMWSVLNLLSPCQNFVTID